MTEAFDIDIHGIVQGVGFRPFVYRLAIRFNLTGWVQNATDGVHIHIEGLPQSCHDFIQALESEAPTAAQISLVHFTPSALKACSDFTIRESTVSFLQTVTGISPDLATCPNCLRELFDQNDRRYGYPFINCTDCGPRFTIINGLPYDRPLTSMSGFRMCERCLSEYHDPMDRRFHAQPDACFACGPVLSLYENRQSIPALSSSDTFAVIRHVIKALYAGKIVAIKGLGGYHLACDATNQSAVLELRQRKRRSNKPLAVMVGGLDQASHYAEINAEEAKILDGSIRPIVLLKRRAADVSAVLPIAEAVAGNLREIGVMLPSTPLQHLLFAELDRPLVMTSGNISEEPIIADTELAHQSLKDIADLFLDNNRPIVSRYDDSVVRVVNGQTQFIRRARGYAPLPLRLPLSVPSQTLLAVGSEQKNTFCLAVGDQAYVSQHLGDMDDHTAMTNWDQTRRLYQQLFKTEASLLASDQHPEYLTSKWASDHARRNSTPLYKVQHHHAHIASVLAEHGMIDRVSPVIGFAFDGTGYGDDSTIWGGEVLLATLTDYRRTAWLRPTALPGGSTAIVEPWRMACSWLISSGLIDHPGAKRLLMAIDSTRLDTVKVMISQQINSPLTSSMGRLFDAVSALTGICTLATYDGEPAAGLEAAIADQVTSGGFETTIAVDQPVFDRLHTSQQPLQTTDHYRFSFDGKTIDPTPVLKAILDDIAADTPVSLIARRFHLAVVAMVVSVSFHLRQLFELNTVALSGGVFMNRFLLEHLLTALGYHGFNVYTNRNLPPNDGCIAYAQAAVTAARLALAGSQQSTRAD